MKSRKPTTPERDERDERDERVSRTTPLLSVAGETMTMTRTPTGQRAPDPTEPWPERGRGLAEGSAPRFTAGAMLADRYRIVHLLGRGGMGEVYRAEDLELEQTVAIKLLPETFERDPERLARLRGEVRLARSVTHPGVCRVYDLQEAHGRHFISMEHVEGEDLGALLRRIGRLSQGKALEIARQLCHGLHAIHDQGILHRDLKPANIMLDRDGQARIMDFGLASVDGALPAHEVAQGTPAYMAPEQLTGQDVSVQSDLYALGLVLYKLFTGHPAHRAGSQAELARVHMDGQPPPPPSSLVPDIAPAVDRVILQCLEPDPGARPRAALDVAAALAESAPAGNGALKALLVCELGGEEIVQSSDAAALRRAHARSVRALLDAHGGQEIDGDAFVALFDHPGDALACALAHQHTVAARARKEGVALESRAAVHLVEARPAELEPSRPGARPWTVAPPARALAHRLLAVAEAGQILLTRAAFDLARARGVQAPGAGDLRWEAHGSYEIDELAEPVELYEVGVDGVAPLRQPRDSDLARRRRVQERITGWRPAPGQGVPGRPQWIVHGKLGEGGFGEVWLARHDKTGERRVFKFCYDAERLRALRREITLFRLLKDTLGERDDIARIHEWNLDQPPYFIEAAYTAGGSLADWAAEQGGIDRVPLDVRLEIIAQVATALAAAHSVGVLHKDIKPANVLITEGDDRVRAQLHDFGVGVVTELGRLVDVSFTVMGMTETASGALAGTRLYMAPEILEGKPATVQADIHAVGVMLYQVVAGDLTRALAPGWERDIDDELLREDIAAAVDRASENRIDSAQRLAERLRALAERRQARALMRREQAEAQRARVALARARRRRRVLMLALAVVTAFAGVTMVQSRRVAHEAEVARRESAAAEQVTSFLLGLFESSDPYRTGGQQVTVRAVLDRGKERIAHELAEQPAVRARLMHTMGVVYSNLSMYDPAASLLEQALAIRRELPGDHRLEVADTLAALAMVWHSREDRPRAEPLAREALAIRAELLDEDHLDLASARELLGDILYEQQEHDAAEHLYRQNLAARRLAGDTVGIGDSLQRLGALLLARGEPHAAKPLYRESLATYRSLLAEDSPQVAHGLRHLAFAHLDGDEPREAEALFRRVLVIEQKIFGDEHLTVVSATGYIALSLLRQGKPDEAEPLYQEALAVYRKLLGEESWSVASIHHDLAQVAHARGDLGRAEPLYRDALARFHRITKPGDIAIARIFNDLGILLQDRGAYDEAERAYRRAMEIFREGRGPADPLTSLATANLADAMLARGAVEEACPLAEQALASLRERFPGGNWRSGHAESVLGACHAARGEHAEAEGLLLRAYEAVREQPGEHWRYGDRAVRRIVSFYEAQDRSESAARYRMLLSASARSQ